MKKIRSGTRTARSLELMSNLRLTIVVCSRCQALSPNVTGLMKLKYSTFPPRREAANNTSSTAKDCLPPSLSVIPRLVKDGELIGASGKSQIAVTPSATAFRVEREYMRGRRNVTPAMIIQPMHDAWTSSSLKRFRHVEAFDKQSRMTRFASQLFMEAARQYARVASRATVSIRQARVWRLTRDTLSAPREDGLQAEYTAYVRKLSRPRMRRRHQTPSTQILARAAASHHHTGPWLPATQQVL